MQVLFTTSFKKKYKKLPEKIRVAFCERLEIFLQNKFDSRLNNHSIDPTYPKCRSINVTGDYRAIFEEENESAIFRIIGTHSELY